MNDKAQSMPSSERRLQVVAGAWLLALLIFLAALAALSGWVGEGIPFLAWSLLAFGLLITTQDCFDLALRRAKLSATLAALLWALLIYGSLYADEAVGHGLGAILSPLLIGFPIGVSAIAVRCIQRRSVGRAI